MNTAVANWIMGHDTGLSSLAIVAFMEGADQGSFEFPRDPSDLGRCIRLLNIAPEYRARLREMGEVSPMWEQLTQHWGELEALYYDANGQGKARAYKTTIRTTSE